MNHNEIVAGLTQEFRRGTLILVVLGQMREPTYGYILVKKLAECEIQIEANTLYPLMRRLEGQGLLESRWETEEAKPRKYYLLSEDGKIVYEKLKASWEKYASNVDNLLKGEI